VTELYNENYETMKKQIEEGTGRWKDLPCSWIRIKILKMAILVKAINRFNETHKNANVVFTEIGKSILKFIRKCKTFQIAKEILRKEQCWRYHNTQLQRIL
jgi:hypothetical protein